MRILLSRAFLPTSIAACALVFVGSGCATRAGRAEATPEWRLVWSDEFAQPNGSPPDPLKWGYDTGGWGWGNREWQYYTRRTNNVRIEDGVLVIEAHKEHHEDRDYTSGRLSTKDLSAWTHGRIEARIRIPRGQGLWPAFWMLGQDVSKVGWPGCGEIDIMENVGREPRIVHGTVHGPGYSGSGGVGGSYTNSTEDLADDFHVYAVEWEQERIRWYVDGELYFAVTPGRIGDATWVFDRPHFILLNVAVGGRWPGYPDGTTVFPQQMRVDYVRVYSRTDPAR